MTRYERVKHLDEIRRCGQDVLGPTKKGLGSPISDEEYSEYSIVSRRCDRFVHPTILAFRKFARMNIGNILANLLPDPISDERFSQLSQKIVQIFRWRANFSVTDT